MTKNDAVERALEQAIWLADHANLAARNDLKILSAVSKDCQEALQAIQTSRPDAGDEEAFSNIVVEAMQGAWNDWCSDTGCFPDDFEWRGPNGKLFFKAGKWSANVAKTIRAALKSGDRGRWQKIDENTPIDKDLWMGAYAENDNWRMDLAVKAANGIIWNWSWGVQPTHWMMPELPPTSEGV